MKVYRAFSLEKNNALKFVKQEDLQFVDELEEKLFGYFFNKTIITKDRETRFGIEGNPSLVYFCEDRLTTYYEYAYWLLKTPNILSKGVKISVMSCTILHKEEAIIKRVEDLDEHVKNKIMDISDRNYINAHKWVKEMSELPDLIIYNSIRYSLGAGKNFAHFEGVIKDIAFVDFDTAILRDKNENCLELLKAKQRIIPRM